MINLKNSILFNIAIKCVQIRLTALYGYELYYMDCIYTLY